MQYTRLQEIELWLTSGQGDGQGRLAHGSKSRLCRGARACHQWKPDLAELQSAENRHATHIGKHAVVSRLRLCRLEQCVRQPGRGTAAGCGAPCRTSGPSAARRPAPGGAQRRLSTSRLRHLAGGDCVATHSQPCLACYCTCAAGAAHVQISFDPAQPARLAAALTTSTPPTCRSHGQPLGALRMRVRRRARLRRPAGRAQRHPGRRRRRFCVALWCAVRRRAVCGRLLALPQPWARRSAAATAAVRRRDSHHADRGRGRRRVRRLRAALRVLRRAPRGRRRVRRRARGDRAAAVARVGVRAGRRRRRGRGVQEGQDERAVVHHVALLVQPLLPRGRHLRAAGSRALRSQPARAGSRLLPGPRGRVQGSAAAACAPRTPPPGARAAYPSLQVSSSSSARSHASVTRGGARPVMTCSAIPLSSGALCRPHASTACP